jgi:acyl carrier protein
MEPMAEVKSRIKLLLADVVGDASQAERVQDDANLIQDVGLDSIQMINFILMIEDEFGFEVDFVDFNCSRFERFDLFCEFVSDSMRAQLKS